MITKINKINSNTKKSEKYLFSTLNIICKYFDIKFECIFCISYFFFDIRPLSVLKRYKENISLYKYV